MSEQSRTSLLQQVGSLQAESDNLRQELAHVSNQLDTQIRKYQDHKTNTKTKMQQARCHVNHSSKTDILVEQNCGMETSG